MSLPCIAVTMGDPAGVGPEICLRALADPQVLEHCCPVVFGDANLLSRVARRCDLPEPPEVIAEGAWPSGDPSGPAVFDLPAEDDTGRQTLEQLEPGSISAATGRASLRYVERAIAAALAGDVDGVVTAPIHKRAWQMAGCELPGHTELFAERTACEHYCMMLTSREISCSLVTTHVGYAEVPGLLATERIEEVIRLTHAALGRLRGRVPRLAVCGLNPHAGEEGLFGEGEEERLIVPAIEAARQLGCDIVGPLPPDTAFLPERRAEVDGYVCMYHDQGLIPLKTLAFDEAVNVTLGLPIVRTSVDHGTALDIAWQGRASASSLREAILLAARLAEPVSKSQAARKA